MHDVRSARAFGLVSSFRLFFTRMYFSIASVYLPSPTSLFPSFFSCSAPRSA